MYVGSNTCYPVMGKSNTIKEKMISKQINKQISKQAPSGKYSTFN